MRAALYARVSTRDKDQDPETQLLLLREYAQARQWEAVEYVDTASATDYGRRTAWRRLMADVGRGRVRVVAVYKLDRAFRSAGDMHATLRAWTDAGCAFRAITQDFDTSTPVGRMMLGFLALMAEFELALIRERVRAGMDRAAKTGTRSGRAIGRPGVLVSRPRLVDRLAPLLPRLGLPAGDPERITLSQVATDLGISRRTVARLVARERDGGIER